MKRPKRRMQVDRGKQGGNKSALNYTHPLDKDVRKGDGDRICGGNLQGFRTTRSTQPPDTDVRNAVGDRVVGGNLQGF